MGAYSSGWDQRLSAWQRCLGALALCITAALAPCTQANAASGKKSAKTATKHVAKAKSGAKTVAARSTPARSGKAASARHAATPRIAVRLDGKRHGKTALKASKSRSVKGGRLARAHQRHVAPRPVLSMGQRAGLRAVYDPLDLHSSVAFVLDQDSHEVLFSKNEHAVLPIASITKLMTGLLVAEAQLPLDEMITITQEDVDTVKGSSSRLPVGSTLSRGELMHLSLMSSENRAAHALGRTYPGGLSHFVSLMNARAIMLGMKDTRYVEPTGLSSDNRSSARDLATLVAEAARNPLLRQWSTSQGHEIAIGPRMLQYHNTNRLVHNPEWRIGVQKTGYISEAGRCLVMQAQVSGRNIIMVFLDSSGKDSRIADAERVRRWVENTRFEHSLAASHLGE